MSSLRLREAVNHGKPAWVVDVPARFTGQKRQRRFFSSKPEAEAFLKTLKTDARAFGEGHAAQFAAMSSRERADLFYQLDRLKRLGFPIDRLGEAVDVIERSKRVGPSLELGKAVTSFLGAKSARNCRWRYMRKLRATMQMFCAGREGMMLSGITPAHVHSFINRNNWSGHTRKSYLSDLNSFFSFCMRQEFLASNPAKAVDAPLLDDKPPGILTVDECQRLVDESQRSDVSLLPFVVLGLFAGVRPAEGARLAWEDITDTAVIVDGHKAKTRSRRVIPMAQLPQLKAFLDAARAAGGVLPPRNLRKRWDALRKRCGLLEGWKHDALRHSFASYHFARYQDANQTSAILGNTPTILFRHYRELVSPEDAEGFFKILPDALLLETGVEAMRRDCEDKTARIRKARRSRTSAAPPLLAVGLTAPALPAGSGCL